MSINLSAVALTLKSELKSGNNKGIKETLKNDCMTRGKLQKDQSNIYIYIYISFELRVAFLQGDSY
jgi:hypothetical protein